MTQTACTPHGDDEKQAILKNIDAFGYHLVIIEPDNYLPGFAYTIGLFQRYCHPEMICFGLGIDMMQTIIHHGWELIHQGEVFQTGRCYDDFLPNHPIQFIEVQKDFYADYAGYAGGFYDSFDFPLLQIVWSDTKDRFPWDQDFNPDWKYIQPLLDRNMDFKFYEPQNLAVLTTKQVLEGEPILFVYHNLDGEWQFHSESQPAVENAKLVSLEQITKLDPSINEIYHLQYGWQAWRSDINTEWVFAEFPEK